MNSPAGYDARGVANALLDIADTKSMKLTHMSVHKLIYYAHGWKLAASGIPLVRQQFEAWRDGPVLRPIWESLKVSGASYVTTRATKFDPILQESKIVYLEIHKAEQELLDNILDAYGHLNAYKLSEMSHVSGGPWDQVWNAPKGTVTLGMKIPNDMIKGYFLNSVHYSSSFTTQ